MFCKNCKRTIKPKDANLPCPECGSLERVVVIHETVRLKEGGVLKKSYYREKPALLVLQILICFAGVFFAIYESGLSSYLGAVIAFLDLAFFLLLPHWRESVKEISSF